MIYVPLLKTRQEELNVALDMNNYFSDEIIPLFEIINEQYETRYKINPITKAFLLEKRGKRNAKIKETPTDADIITLDNINELVEDKKAFIDYFRFTIEKYGKNFDFSKVELAWKLSGDSDLYKKKLLEVSKYENLIPTISIKSGFEMKKNELKSLLKELQSRNDIVALRITDEFLDLYSELIINDLRHTDYFLFDIGEQNPNSKIMEFDEVKDINIKARTILLNSPRKANIKNGDYEEFGITELIDNSARELFREYEFDGFGDYCGLKDALPTTGGSNGTGAALSLIYDYEKNGFYSFLNPDTSRGMRGYYKIIPVILSKKNILDPLDICPAIEKVEDLKGPGNWCTWHNITATRYIFQIYHNI